MGRLVSKGDVALYRSTFEGEVTLFDAAIVGNLFARSSKFNGVNKDDNSKYPFELWKARVAQSTEFTNSVFKGEVSADYAVFGTDVKFDGTTFKQPARFKNVQFNDIADFRGSIFMEAATFENSIVKRDIQFTDAKFRNEANFKYLSVGRFLNFSNNPLNTEDFMGDEGSKELNELKGTIFSGAVNLEGVKVGDVLDFRNASSAELLKISLAEVNGQTLFEKFISPDGLDLSHNHFGDLKIIGQQGKEFAGINLDATSINGDLYIQDVDVTNDFSAQDLVAKDSTTFMKLKVNRDLNLSNASLGSFTMSSDQFWTKPDETKNGIIYYLNLRGATYANIGFATLDGDELRYQEFKGGQAGFLGEMVAASEYSPQAYRTLETFLTEKGRSSNAADIEYDRKVRERDSLAPWSPAWVLSWFRWVFSGYGKYPWLAFLWSLILITISAVVFWYQEDLTKDQKESPGKLFFYCFLYSFFLFFTFVVLEFTKDWEPKKTETSFKVYKQFHKMLGLLIAPTAVLVFGGLIK